jgi:hypothetical protein
MSVQDLARADWEAALANGHTLALVVELGLLSPELRLRLFTEHSVWPLLQQAEVAHLSTEGPALVELSDQPFARQIALHEQLTRSAQHGWLSSRLNMIELQKHLGDGMACRNIDGETLLIRSYAHSVLPKLYARQQQPWHTWLFGPIVHWWLPTTQGWQRLQGLAQSGVPPYHPIELDQRLVDELGTDPHAQALVAELQSHAPEVFASECHGERLNQAGQALSQAREAGLTRHQDQYFHALYSLLSGSPISQSKHWPTMLKRVEHEGLELAQVQLELDEQVDDQG